MRLRFIALLRTLKPQLPPPKISTKIMSVHPATPEWASTSSEEAGNTTPRAPSRRRSTKRRSVVLRSPKPTQIPIPPSLLQSPYLSPDSIFQRELPSSSPSEEDEQWLQDTVPIIHQHASLDLSSGPSAANSSPVVVDGHLAPLSPPIVRSKSAVSFRSRGSESSSSQSAPPGRRSLSRDYFRDH